MGDYIYHEIRHLEGVISCNGYERVKKAEQARADRADLSDEEILNSYIVLIRY